PDHPDRMIGGHQRLQIDCPKLDLIAYRFPHPWLSRIAHSLIFLYRKIGKKLVARHRCTSRTVQQQESLPACKLNPNRAQRFTTSEHEPGSEQAACKAACRCRPALRVEKGRSWSCP